jgi:uncharacterized protein YgiM (DUF1202 family)
MKTILLSAMLVGLTATPGAAKAAERYAASIDVNIRSGPGAHYPIVEVLHSGQAISAERCDAGWCSVTGPGGGAGWIASRFLSPATPAAAEAATVTGRAAPINSAAPSASPGQIDTTTTAAIPTVGAPASLGLPDAVRKYVATHRPVSVELGDEPKVGGTIPADIRLRDIPGSRYRYVYVEGHPVFVDGETRQIVQIEQ